MWASDPTRRTEERFVAWIRLEAQDGIYGDKQRYDGACEEYDDLEAEVTNGYAVYNGSHVVLAVGSGAVCMETKKVYLKKSDLSWGEA